MRSMTTPTQRLNHAISQNEQVAALIREKLAGKSSDALWALMRAASDAAAVVIERGDPVMKIVAGLGLAKLGEIIEAKMREEAA